MGDFYQRLATAPPVPVPNAIAPGSIESALTPGDGLWDRAGSDEDEEEAGENEESFDEALAMVRRSRNHRVIERMQLPAQYSELTGPRKCGAIVDCETTSKHSDEARIIQIGIQLFEYDGDGHVGRVLGHYSAMEDPGEPLDPEIVAVTGLTDAMLKGQSIDDGAVAAALHVADLVIAHNATYDRPVVERRAPPDYQAHPWRADTKPWACSRSDIPWSSFGIRGEKLDYLAYRHGFFHEAHAALDDVRATLHLLAQPVESIDFLDVGRTNLTYLLESVAKPVYKVLALKAPFVKKDRLSGNGYHWHDRKDGTPKYWWKYVTDVATEQKWLKAKIYRGMEFGAKMAPVTRLNMFSVRG